MRRGRPYHYMSGESILDTIISQQQGDSVARLDVVDAMTRLLGHLNEREIDIIKRRFGLKEAKKATLDEIGQSHNLTRERIRQIETGSINKVKKAETLNEILSDIRKVVSALIKDHGGIMDREYLFDMLWALDARSGEKADKDLYHNHFDFILSKLLGEEFKEVKDSKHFNPFFKHHYEEIVHLEDLASELVESIKSTKSLLLTHEMIEHAKNLQSFKSNSDKLDKNDFAVDIKDVLSDILPEHDHASAKDSRVLFSLVKALSEIDQNTFGHWGHAKSSEVRPKTVNDKIYLVLKQHGKPMHYEDIGKAINSAGFDKKTVNTATVHNELILDDNYVLVGRGLYALREWGYNKGTVADVIADILKKNAGPMPKKNIIEEVLKQRMVKKTTIDLALMNKKRFTRLPGANYTLTT